MSGTYPSGRKDQDRAPAFSPEAPSQGVVRGEVVGEEEVEEEGEAVEGGEVPPMASPSPPPGDQARWAHRLLPAPRGTG